jgi:hypothetical protein
MVSTPRSREGARVLKAHRIPERISALLRGANVVVNHKAVGRIWQQLGLQLARRHRRKKIRGGEVVPQLAKRPNHLWTCHFAFAWTLGVSKLKALTLGDGDTRQSPAIEVGRGFRGLHGREVLAIGTHVIAPGKPWQMRFADSCKARFREACLAGEAYHGVAKARIIAKPFSRRFNEEHPQSSFGDQTPNVFEAICASGALAPDPGDLSPWATPGARRTRAGRIQPPPSGGPGSAREADPSGALSSVQAGEKLT